MTFHAIAPNPKARHLAVALAAVGLIFAVVVTAQSGLLSEGYEWLTQTLIDVPHRVMTNLTSLPERFNPTWMECR